VNPEVSHYITPYDFHARGNVEKKKELEKFIGRGFYNRLSDFYSNLDDVYADFNLDKNLVMSCDTRHQEFYDKGWNTEFKDNAAKYLCADDAPSCIDTKKKVFLDYCLDLNDTLDWVAVQSAFLNAEGRYVVIPPHKEFHVNQSLVMPDGLNVNWFAAEGAETLTPGQTDGTHYVRPGASFIKFVPQNEPINMDQPRKTGFSIGSVFNVARIERGIDCVPNNTPPNTLYGFAPYSGISATIREPNRVMVALSPETAASRKPCNEGIVRNITLRYPHIDVNNVIGENGISFGLGAGGNFDAQGFGPLKVYGGVIKNVKINTFKRQVTNQQGETVLTSAGVVAFAGGKAIQCEAGCRGLDIRGISIVNADIGVNSNALSRLINPADTSKTLANYELLNLFEPGKTSQVRVLGLRTIDVDSPLNIANTIDGPGTSNQDAAQEVKINHFAFYNSGSGEWSNPLTETNMCLGDLDSGTIGTQTTSAFGSARDGGIVMSRNGKNIEIKNGKIINENTYPGVPALVNVLNSRDKGDIDNDGDLTELLIASPVTVENVTYSTKYRN